MVKVYLYLLLGLAYAQQQCKPRPTCVTRGVLSIASKYPGAFYVSLYGTDRYPLHPNVPTFERAASIWGWGFDANAVQNFTFGVYPSKLMITFYLANYISGSPGIAASFSVGDQVVYSTGSNLTQTKMSTKWTENWYQDLNYNETGMWPPVTGCGVNSSKIETIFGNLAESEVSGKWIGWGNNCNSTIPGTQQTIIFRSYTDVREMIQPCNYVYPTVSQSMGLAYRPQKVIVPGNRLVKVHIKADDQAWVYFGKYSYSFNMAGWHVARYFQLEPIPSVFAIRVQDYGWQRYVIASISIDGVVYAVTDYSGNWLYSSRSILSEDPISFPWYTLNYNEYYFERLLLTDTQTASLISSVPSPFTPELGPPLILADGSCAWKLWYPNYISDEFYTNFFLRYRLDLSRNASIPTPLCPLNTRNTTAATSYTFSYNGNIYSFNFSTLSIINNSVPDYATTYGGQPLYVNFGASCNLYNIASFGNYPFWPPPGMSSTCLNWNGYYYSLGLVSTQTGGLYIVNGVVKGFTLSYTNGTASTPTSGISNTGAPRSSIYYISCDPTLSYGKPVFVTVTNTGNQILGFQYQIYVNAIEACNGTISPTTFTTSTTTKTTTTRTLSANTTISISTNSATTSTTTTTTPLTFCPLWTTTYLTQTSNTVQTQTPINMNYNNYGYIPPNLIVPGQVITTTTTTSTYTKTTNTPVEPVLTLAKSVPDLTPQILFYALVVGAPCLIISFVLGIIFCYKRNSKLNFGDGIPLSYIGNSNTPKKVPSNVSTARKPAYSQSSNTYSQSTQNMLKTDNRPVFSSIQPAFDIEANKRVESIMFADDQASYFAGAKQEDKEEEETEEEEESDDDEEEEQTNKSSRK